MSTPPTIPMFSPDGQTGDVPQANASDAIKAGFKPAYEMTAPDGRTLGYIPADKAKAAFDAGFKPTAESHIRSFNAAGQPVFGSDAPPSTMELYKQALFNPAGAGAASGVMGAVEQVGGRAMQGILSPVMHPIDTLKSMGGMVREAALGSPQSPLYNPAALAQNPGPIGQRAQEFSDEWKRNKALALENAAGDVAGAVEGGRLGNAAGRQAAPFIAPVADAAENVAGRGAQWARPTSSPLVVPEAETAARQLSAAILPATKDAANFIKAAQQEVPNVIDFARRTGNALNTQLEFSKAAQGYAQEVRGLYDNEVLGPNSSKLVRTTGTGFGERPGEGPDTYATLGEIDKRITSINTQLDKPALNADDARRALASKTGLQQEAQGLRSILHRNLSDATGLTPDQVANLRQRVGRSYELANDTDAAVTQRMQNASPSKQIPTRLSELPSQAVQFARGGPVAIADRAFQKAINNFPGTADPLPGVTAPTHPPSSSARMNQLLTAARQKQQALRDQLAPASQSSPLR